MGLFKSKKSESKKQSISSQFPGIHFVDQEEFDKIKSAQSETALRQTAALHFNLAENYRSKGDTFHARNYYLHAIENISDLAEKSKDKTDRTILYFSNMRLADSFFEEGDYKSTIAYSEKASYAAMLLSDVEPDDYQHSLDACKHLQLAGYCYLSQNQYKQAYSDYYKSLRIIRELEDRTGKNYVHPYRENRTFDAYRPESCYKLAKLQAEHPEIRAEEKTHDLCDECTVMLLRIYKLTIITDNGERAFDFANGLYLCALCLKGKEKKEYLELAEDACEKLSQTCQNRAQFLKLQKMIRKEME